MFGFFGRKRMDVPAPGVSFFSPSQLEACDFQAPQDPEDQVALVCQTVQKLNEVKRMVDNLPELPMGDREALLAQLASTSDSLRSLYFLDAIY